MPALSANYVIGSFLHPAKVRYRLSPVRTTFVRCHVFRPALDILCQQLKLAKGEVLQERDCCFDCEEDAVGFRETVEGLPLAADQDAFRGWYGMVLQQALGLKENRFPWFVGLDNLDEVAGAFHGRFRG